MLQLALISSLFVVHLLASASMKFQLHSLLQLALLVFFSLQNTPHFISPLLDLRSDASYGDGLLMQLLLTELVVSKFWSFFVREEGFGMKDGLVNSHLIGHVLVFRCFLLLQILSDVELLLRIDHPMCD